MSSVLNLVRRSYGYRKAPYILGELPTSELRGGASRGYRVLVVESGERIIESGERVVDTSDACVELFEVTEAGYVRYEVLAIQDGWAYGPVTILTAPDTERGYPAAKSRVRSLALGATLGGLLG